MSARQDTARHPPGGQPVRIFSRRARDRLDDALLRTVDLGLAGVLFVAPLFLGGRHPVGKLVLVAIVWATAAAWSLRQCLDGKARWRRCGAELILLAAVVLVIAQLVRWPQSWLLRLSPALAELLPLWTPQTGSAVGLGPWSQISLTPEATRGGLVLLLSYAMLYVMVVQRIGSLGEIERLLRWLALAAASMAVVGLAQFFGGNGKFLWVYQHPYRGPGGAVMGPFSNQNHFAHFLALGIGPLVWWLQRVLRRGGRQQDFSRRARSVGRERRLLDKLALSAALAAVAFAGLLSFSRGGVLVMLLAVGVCVGIYARASILDKRSAAALVGVGLLVGAAVLVSGCEPLAKRLGTLVQSQSLEQLSGGRKRVWASVGRAIPRFLVLGAGVGSHREVYPIYFTGISHVEYTYAENGYLQVLLETGAVGLGLLLVGIGLSGYWCVEAMLRGRSVRATACAGALFAGLLASAVHSLTDFVWYIPACMSLAVVLAGCACRLYQLTRPVDRKGQDSVWLPQAAWVAISAAVMVLSVPLISSRLGPAMAASHWERYLAASEQASDGSVGPTDATKAEQSVDAMIRHLEETLRWHPNDARANLRMAAACLRRYDLAQQASENAMPLPQVRDAAQWSHFRSRAALDRWLARAVGDNRKYLDRALRHTRRALELSPLQGEGYVYLSELAFLDGADRQANARCIAQALKVRPHKGLVLFAAGAEAVLSGDADRAIRYFQKAFRAGQQSAIIELLGPQVPASFFLETFQPDVRATRMLLSYYRRTGRDEPAKEVGRGFAAMLQRAAQEETGAQAARLWHEAQAICGFLGDEAQAIHCAKMAVAAAPNDFDLRRALAAALVARHQYSEGIAQLRWCLRRSPLDQSLRAQLEFAMRQQLQRTSPLKAAEDVP